MPPAGSGGGEESLSERILHHVSDGPVLIPLHLGPIDLSVSKHVVLLWFTALLTFALFVWYSRHLGRVKDGVATGKLANMVDFWVQYIHDKMVSPLIGEEHAADWT